MLPAQADLCPNSQETSEGNQQQMRSDSAGERDGGGYHLRTCITCQVSGLIGS
jgi:hypothetical protein